MSWKRKQIDKKKRVVKESKKQLKLLRIKNEKLDILELGE